MTEAQYCEANPGEWDCPVLENFMVFENPNWEGDSDSFGIGVYDEAKFGPLLGRVSSVKVPAGIQAVLYTKGL